MINKCLPSGIPGMHFPSTQPWSPISQSHFDSHPSLLYESRFWVNHFLVVIYNSSNFWYVSNSVENMFTFIVLHIFCLQMNLHLTRFSSQPSLALFFAPQLRQSSSLLQALLVTSCTLWIGMILSFAAFLLVVDRNFALCLDKCSSSFEDNIRVSAFFSFVLIVLGPIDSSVVVNYRKD